MDDFHRQTCSDQASHAWDDRHHNERLLFAEQASDSYRQDDYWLSRPTNPSTGLPLIGGIDIAGYPLGGNVPDNHFDNGFSTNIENRPLTRGMFIKGAMISVAIWMSAFALATFTH